MKKAENDSAAQAASPRFTVEAKKVTFGKFAYDASREVSEKQFAELANEGFKSQLQAASAKADMHVLFGNYKGGKDDPRPKSYVRGAVAFSEDRAEALRGILATSAKDVQTAVTVYQYTPSTWTVAAKDTIARKGSVETSLVKLAAASGFEFEDWTTLTVDNDAFVEAVALMLSSI